MIIVQTPLRVSLFGGGTDFYSYFSQHGGCVLSAAIDKYIFVTIKQRFDKKIRVGYTKTEMVDTIEEVQHELIREALRKTGIKQGIEITTMGDIPSAGSGLGSSSTVTVGALQAMYTYLGEIVTADRLAQEACEIEIDILKKPIGIQDQYIVSYGGLRLIEFTKEGVITSRRLNLGEKGYRLLSNNLMLFFTGITRSASSILQEQNNKVTDNHAYLQQLKQFAYDAFNLIENGNVDSIGEMLHESWQIKKKLASNITNGPIEDYYEAARKAGAIGGKISGAGGGGFLLLYCPANKQENVRQVLSGLQELPFSIERDGTKVIFNYRRVDMR
ncbi:GHMP kinase [Ornatilinea apprima]|uniref:GHMP kinase n=1 Tax=Ornatilinea apprima TaxID=1134406 RepID=A0A0P6Y6J8_9CHLR|nr:GHMP kinase [Ornatilinea apprima]KPL81053.1 GHMP kinase [Ornatilinea apprima]